MEYPLDEELAILKKWKMPAKLRLLPMMNLLRGAYKWRSDAEIHVEECKIPGYEGDERVTHIIEPKHTNKLLPCMLLLHGGGFMLRASAIHYHFAKEYALGVPCKVIVPDYRLAPDFPFPTPVEDCYAAYQWILNHVDELGIDKTKIMIAGDSAGGNLALAVVLMARDRGLALPASLMLVYPSTDRRMTAESIRKYKDAPVWDLPLSEMMWEAYLGEQKLDKVEYVSPLEAESFQEFPPVYIEVAEFDSIRDEGIMLYERLKEDEVSACLYEVKSACHGFETVYESRITKECLKRRMRWLQSILGDDVS